MVEGLRKPDGGSIVVDGHAVWPDPKPVKRIIGVQLQATALFDYQKLWEILYVFGSTYGIRRSKQECVALLERVGIAEKAEAYVEQLSGGQAQRLSIALALVNDPVVTFLDEPTTGLDPRARRALWDVIREINYAGTTVVLTSHYMEEAERLCDRVAVMDRGTIMDSGPPQLLINKLGAEAVVTFTLSERQPLSIMRGLRGVNDCRAQEEVGYELVASDAQHVVTSLLALADDRGVKVENLDVKGATLEDVFLQLTGHKLGDEEEAATRGDVSTPKHRRFGSRRRGR